MPRKLVLAMTVFVALGACAAPVSSEPAADLQETITISVFRSPT